MKMIGLEGTKKITSTKNNKCNTEFLTSNPN